MGKKKLTKKEKAKMEAEHAETLRIEMEKERMKKLEEDRDRKIRERRDAKKKQEQEAVENKIRRVQLRESSHVFKSLKEDIKTLTAEEKLTSNWIKFMRCNGLPNANDPSDLRKYIHMWMDNMQQNTKSDMNYLLKVNEKSILTQDQSVPNMSKENLKKMQTNFGAVYAKRAKEVLGILYEIEGVVRDKYTLSISKMEDLLDLKYEFCTVLGHYIDEFSFKVLSNISSNMEMSGLMQANHKFLSEVFNTELYALRDIPQPPQNIPKEKMKEDRTNITFAGLGMDLVLPPTIRVHNSAIRGLWFTYDHLSNYCHSSIFKYNNLEKKKLTLRQTTKREWKKRKELLAHALFQIFNEKPPVDSGDDKDKEAPQARIIDVDKMYTEYEDELNNLEKEKMGPIAMNLGEFESNLRSHRITGGIFLLEYLEQPLQNVKTSSGSLLRTLIHPVKLKKKQFHYPYRTPPPAKPGVRRQPEEIEAEIKLMEENLERLVLVNVALPEDVSWFEPPIVCRWETDDEFNEMKLIEEELGKKKVLDEDEYEEMDEVLIEKNKKDIAVKKPKSVKRLKVIEDFNLLDIPARIRLQSLFEDFVVPLIPDGYEIKFEQKKINEFGKRIFKENKIYTIDDVIYQTKDSRPLFPNYQTKQILKVVKDRSKFLKFSPGLEISTDEENDESLYSADSEIGIKTNVYMFSKFMRDLEDLIETELPNFEKKIAEISSNFSEAHASTSAGLDRQNSGISITKTNSKSLLDVTSSPSDSDQESDTDNEAEDLDIQENSMIDLKVRNANIQRCNGRWSTRDIHDLKFNEDKLTVQFRTGRLGAFGFASNRYSNLPYQSWELKPDYKAPGTAIFTLTASVIGMEVIISEKGILLNSLQGCSPSVLSNSIGTLMPLYELINTMRDAACDIFPDDDAFCYTEGTCEKNYVMEKHIYDCMTCFALSHNFSWSRWNIISGSRTAVFLMRELIEHRKLPHQSTVHVTPFKSCLIDCTEVSPIYNPVPLAPASFYADLHNLAMSSIQPASLSKLESMNPVFRQNIVELLKACRPLSFC